MPPAATLEFRGPANFSFDSTNATSSTSNHSEYGSFSTGSAAAARLGSTASARTRHRLAKQRRSSKPSSANGAGVADSGININPFQSVCSQSVDASNLTGNVVSPFENVGFVFGVSNTNGTNENADPVSVDSTGLGTSKLGNVDSGVRVDIGLGKADNLQKEEFKFSGGVGEPQFNEMPGKNNDLIFNFGASANGRTESTDNQNVQACKIGSEFELSEEMRKKLNIENKGKVSCSVETVQGWNNADVLKNGDRLFVFNSGVESCGVSAGSSAPLKSEADATNSDQSSGSFNARKTGGGFGSQPVKENIFVFGGSGNSARPDVSSFQFQFSAFPAETDEVKVKGNGFVSSSSSSLGAESVVGKSDLSSGSEDRKTEFGFGASSADFKLPDVGASLSFSANLANGLGNKPESVPRSRGSRDKQLKKGKGKLKQNKAAKLLPTQKSMSIESITQEQETPESYSPMDFSPYEETSLNNEQATDESNLSNAYSSSVFEGPQPKMGFMNDVLGATSTDSADFSSNLSSHHGGGSQFCFGANEANGSQFCFGANEANGVEQKFAFTASSPAQEKVLLQRRQHRKRYTAKKGSVSGATSASRGSTLGSKPLLSRLQDQAGNFVTSESMSKQGNEGNEEQEGESALSAAEKACDKWRRRGNEAYEKGELPKAEDFYTWGVNSVPPDDTSGVAFRPLVRCYSNRAATRMALGRVREAIQDCVMAVKLDPTFYRAQIRAANCHLLLGELEDAIQGFEKSMDSSNAVCLDRHVVISASEGIQKTKKVIECINRSAELLKLRTSEAATSALESITEAMSISSYSERLLEMKAEALCMLRKHEEAITLCQQTLDFAEKNFTAKAPGNLKVDDSFPGVRSWRHRILCKCHFHQGRLEMALDLLEKLESDNKTQESTDALAVTIRELLKQKSAGNAAFQSGRHAEAIEHYTSAISNSLECRPFAAICYCNRAAAHQALGQMADAIADCSLAIALDENYVKAISRRATLHEMIRDYKQAAADLQRLVCLLEKQSHEKSKQSGSGNGKELRQVQQRLSTMEEEAKREVPLDLYLILGIKKSDPPSEIKKAYRKAALRHHPDKATQALVRSDVGDEGRAWKDIAELVHKDSDRLFKMIGEAYAVLSDPTKREEYDHAEDMRKVLKESNNTRSSSRRYSDYYSEAQAYPFGRSSNRRYWQESYRSYSSAYSRW